MLLLETYSEEMLDTNEMAEIARNRALFYSLVNIPFMNIPDLEFTKRIRSVEFQSALESIADNHHIHSDMAQGAKLMLNHLRATVIMEAAALSKNLGIDRTRLYRGVAPGYGPPPPWEGAWSFNNVAAVLLELTRIYRVSGIEVSAEVNERLDYVGVQLEYLHLLALKEEEAWQKNQKKVAQELIHQQYHFLSEHIGRWVPLFIQDALPIAQTDFYRGHLTMLRGFLADEQHYLQSLA